MRKKIHKKSDTLADDWFDRAEDDIKSIHAILDDKEGAPSTACFLSQQCAEKYLKGFLVFHRQTFPKVHQLDHLLRLCEHIDKDFASLRDEAEFLSAFYIAARYPGDFPQFGFKTARAAFDKALAIQEFIKKRTSD